jgi:DNA-directed RNA polymerase subunit H (RpoH/RPB5)
LTSLFPVDNNEFRNSIYAFSKRILPETIIDKVILSESNNSIWENSDKIQTKRIVSLIAETKSIAVFADNYNFSSKVEALNWLNEFATFLDKNDFDNLLNLKNSSILPNQNGIFRYKDELLIDNTELVSEELKDISGLLGHDFRNDLLAKEIFPVIPEVQSVEIRAIADKITELIEPRLGSIERDDSTKELFRKLYLWFNKNKPLAEQIFDKLYDKKHRLIDDDEIASNLEKAELLDNLIEETGLSAKLLKDKLKELLSIPNIAEFVKQLEKVSENNDSLYPVGSEDDIMISDTLNDSSSENSRISISQEAQEIILQELRIKGFSIPESIQINFTVIEGVTNPSGKPIKIVVKSGKAGKIYFNPNEWLALTEADTQLFAVTSGNRVKNITLADLEKTNDIFHMRFNTSAFAVNTNLKAFANFFRYLKYTHFIFETPESTSDYLQEFGLNQRNLTASDLSADDKNLLH